MCAMRRYRDFEERPSVRGNAPPDPEILARGGAAPGRAGRPFLVGCEEPSPLVNAGERGVRTCDHGRDRACGNAVACLAAARCRCRPDASHDCRRGGRILAASIRKAAECGSTRVVTRAPADGARARWAVRSAKAAFTCFAGLRLSPPRERDPERDGSARGSPSSAFFRSCLLPANARKNMSAHHAFKIPGASTGACYGRRPTAPMRPSHSHARIIHIGAEDLPASPSPLALRCPTLRVARLSPRSPRCRCCAPARGAAEGGGKVSTIKVLSYNQSIILTYPY